MIRFKLGASLALGVCLFVSNSLAQAATIREGAIACPSQVRLLNCQRIPVTNGFQPGIKANCSSAVGFPEGRPFIFRGSINNLDIVNSAALNDFSGAGVTPNFVRKNFIAALPRTSVNQATTSCAYDKLVA